MARRFDTVRIVREAKRGDREPAELLFEKFLPFVERNVGWQLGRHLQPRIDPMDVVQAVCIRILKNLPNIRDENSGAFRLWILTAIRHEVLTQAGYHRASRRDVRREVRLDGHLDAVAEPDGCLSAQERRDDLRRAVEALPAHYRQVLSLRYDLKLSWDDVGHRLGCTPGAAKMLCQRAYAKLRRSPKLCAAI